MEKTIIIGLDLAKNVFQAHGARADGSVAFRKKLTRNQVLPFFAEQPVLGRHGACYGLQEVGGGDIHLAYHHGWGDGAEPCPVRGAICGSGLA